MINYDIIKLLNLESLDIDPSYSHIEKESNGDFILYIELTKKNNYICPCCSCQTNKIHDYRSKKIIHGLYLDRKLRIDYKFRRLICLNCNKIFSEDNPFSKSKDYISEYTKRMIIFKLKDFHSTYSSVATDYHVSVHSVMNIFDEYITCTRRSLDEYVSFDEFYLGSKHKNKYAFIIYNPIKDEIIDVVPCRHKNYLIKYFLENYSYEERSKVKFVSIDMYLPYKQVIKKVFQNPIIAVDSFHVIEHLTKAMDDFRIKTMSSFSTNTDKLINNDIIYYFLKKFHYFFTKDFDKIYSGDIKVPKIKSKMKKDQILKFLLSIDKNLTEAYELKEQYRFFNTHTIERTLLVEGRIESFAHKFRSTPNELFQEFGNTILNWIDEICNSFVYLNGKRLSNGPIESVNSRIKIILKNACGVTSFNRLRNRIMYSLNKNQPLTK